MLTLTATVGDETVYALTVTPWYVLGVVCPVVYFTVGLLLARRVYHLFPHETPYAVFMLFLWPILALGVSLLMFLDGLSAVILWPIKAGNKNGGLRGEEEG